ncbi:MAG: hypothetical protein NTX86_05315 [Candidatus Dependentiae bacterium]|nr:hypothetical protein [Candidatus Dependentiae bacterium]
MKQIRYYALYALLSIIIPQYTHADTQNIDSFDFDFDDMDVDGSLDQVVIDSSVTRATPHEIIDALETFGGIELLKENIYLHTNPLNKRSLLDYAMMGPQQAYCNNKWTVGIYLFYNQTTRTYFTSGSDAFCSYLAITSPTLIEKITNSINLIKPLFPHFAVDPLKILPLFKNSTAQERRIGFMVHGMRQYESMYVRFMTPLYYDEHNYFLTDGERQDIETELGALTANEQQKFQKHHLISDKLGFGDTRIEVDFKLLDRHCHTLHCAAQFTLPTAVAMVKGIQGTEFDKCAPRPNFDFKKLFELSQNASLTPQDIKDQATKLLQDFSIGALDQLGACVLETGLGNGGHIGLGGSFTLENKLSSIIHKSSWAESFYLYNKASVEYLCPAHERRFFIQEVNLAAFNARDFNSTDPKTSFENLEFLNTQFVNRFYPFSFKTLVSPGFIFHWISSLNFDSEHMGFDIGGDVWTQGHEKLSNIHTCDYDCKDFGVNNAVLPLAIQAKILASLLFKATRESHEWIVSFNGDYAVITRGIGKDYTASVNVEMNF